MKVLRDVAKVNGKTLPNEELALTVEKPEDSQNGNLFDLFRTWSIARITLVMFMLW